MCWRRAVYNIQVANINVYKQCLARDTNDEAIYRASSFRGDLQMIFAFTWNQKATEWNFWRFLEVWHFWADTIIPNISSCCNCNHFVASYFNFQSFRIFLKLQLFTFGSARIWQNNEERLTALVWILSSGISFEIIREEEVEQAFNWNAIPLLWSNSIHQSRLIMIMMMMTMITMMMMMMTIPLV